MKNWRRIWGWLAAGAGVAALVWAGGLPAAPVPNGTASATTNILGRASRLRGTNVPPGGLRQPPRPFPPGANPAAPAQVRPGQATNPFSRVPRSPLAAGRGRTNGAPRGVGPGAKAGAAPAQPVAGSAKAGSKFLEKLRQWRNSPSFSWMVSTSLFGLVLAGLLLARYLKSRKGLAPTPGLPASMARRKAPAAAVRWCTVLQAGGPETQLWHFSARGGSFVLNRQQSLAAGEALPARLVAKDWRTLFQRNLNIAWLPPEQVFLRVAHLPVSDYTETVSMVELQLEKLSPMPVTQIVWSLCVLPQVRDNQQTVVVMMAARSAVEEFLGRLEGQGFLADRLELAALDQLQATPIAADGAWIYAGSGPNKHTALVAWWYGGVLQNLDLITLPPLNRPEALREQMMQIAWAGEMDGWLTSTPDWHLVADAEAAAEWEPALSAGLESSAQVSAPRPPLETAALTATRATQAEAQANLLPPEFSTRYQQQFVDRLWMGSLGAVIGLYILGVAVYLVALGVAVLRTQSVEHEAAELGPAYTNAMSLKARYEVLQDRQELKYAALDSWQALAELLPQGVTLDGFNFSDGKRLSLSGTAPNEQQQDLFRFDGALRKFEKDGLPLFGAPGESMSMHSTGPNAATVNWNTVLELKRVEAQ